MIIYLAVIDAVMVFVALIPILIVWHAMQIHWTGMLIILFLGLLVALGTLNKKKPNRDLLVATTYTSILLFFYTVYFLVGFLSFTQDASHVLRWIVSACLVGSFLVSTFIFVFSIVQLTPVTPSAAADIEAPSPTQQPSSLSFAASNQSSSSQPSTRQKKPRRVATGGPGLSDFLVGDLPTPGKL
jgi:uncharacterized membrane protein